MDIYHGYLIENWKLIQECFARPASGITNFLLWVAEFKDKVAAQTNAYDA